jgi:hypothetical protein
MPFKVDERETALMMRAMRLRQVLRTPMWPGDSLDRAAAMQRARAELEVAERELQQIRRPPLPVVKLPQPPKYRRMPGDPVRLDGKTLSPQARKTMRLLDRLHSDEPAEPYQGGSLDRMAPIQYDASSVTCFDESGRKVVIPRHVYNLHVPPMPVLK